jgi:hypothetical protein
MATVTQTSQSTVTVNAAFLQEIKEVNQELWQLLANLREVCSSAMMVRQHTAQLVDMLTELRDQLALHFALEEAFGYFEDPVYAPHFLAERASQLRSEHRRLYLHSNRLADEAEQLQFEGNFAEIVTLIPLRFADLDRELLDHESRENELIMNQFDELGVGD